MNIHYKEHTPTLEMQVSIGKDYFSKKGISITNSLQLKQLISFVTDEKLAELEMAALSVKKKKKVEKSIVDAFYFDDRKHLNSKREEKLELYCSIIDDNLVMPSGVRFFTYSDPNIMFCIFNRLKSVFGSEFKTDSFCGGYKVQEF